MTVGSDRSLKMLATALEKEKKGREFYKGAAAKCSNEFGRDLFQVLAAEEGIHIKRINKIYETLHGGKAWPSDWKAYKQENENLRKLFRERMNKLGKKIKIETTDLEAVEIGLEIEKGALKFYEDELSNATEPLEKEFIKLMIAEERAHFASLADAKLFLTDPEAWLAEKAKGILDGA